MNPEDFNSFSEYLEYLDHLGHKWKITTLPDGSRRVVIDPPKEDESEWRKKTSPKYATISKYKADEPEPKHAEEVENNEMPADEVRNGWSSSMQDLPGNSGYSSIGFDAPDREEKASEAKIRKVVRVTLDTSIEKIQAEIDKANRVMGKSNDEEHVKTIKQYIAGLNKAKTLLTS